MGKYSYYGNGKLMTNTGGKIEDEDEIAQIIAETPVQSQADYQQAVNDSIAQNSVIETKGVNLGAVDKDDDAGDGVEGTIGTDVDESGVELGSEGKSVKESNSKSYADIIGQIASTYVPSQSESPVYDDKYSASIDAAVQSLAQMNYNDWAKGATYQDLVKRYGNAGNLAMQDTMGQVASRTGGMASTYAQSAGQQSYNKYMQALEDAAQSQYQAERDEMQSDIDNLRALRSDDLSTFNSQYSDWLTDKQYQDSKSEQAREDIINYLATYGGNPEDLSEEQLALAGFSDAQLQQFKNAYQTETEDTTSAVISDALSIGSYDDAKNFFANNSTDNVESIINMLVDNGTITEDEAYSLYSVYGDHTEDVETGTDSTILSSISTKFQDFNGYDNAVAYLQQCVNDGTITATDAITIWNSYAKKDWINNKDKPTFGKE